MTTTSPASGSDPPAVAVPEPPSTSSAFERFHPRVRQWIWDQGWQSLRSAQEHAAAPIMAGDRDVIVAAATASGKTEAAWLPICSVIAMQAEDDTAEPGVKALYLSPLKALINDQHSRLDQLCEHLDLPVHRWHGDVAGSQKRLVTRNPDGLLLITPESLESLFVNQGEKIVRLFGGLRYVVIDELHSFIGTERGAQLRSLLHRLELAVRHRIPRIALSATLGDFGAAAEFLRPGAGPEVAVVSSVDADSPRNDDRTELRMQLRGYIAADPVKVNADPTGETGVDYDKGAIADHLFATLRGSDNLVFTNARGLVEIYTDLLSRRSAAANVPNEFQPHHGNLSKEVREHVEDRLKASDTPTTAVCTSTLEMGIDIGSADSVAQIGSPLAVSVLRQRLGRSGRRGQPAVLRMYVSEPELTDHTPPADALRSQLMQTIAMVDLLLERWYEPPDLHRLHLSTLLQQILSVIAQRGGAEAEPLFDALCAHGPFRTVDKGTFVALLRAMGEADLISQDTEGLLLPGSAGEKLINHFSFYTAFTTDDEYRLVSYGRTLGSLPVEYPISVGSLLIFSGRRWRVLAVESQQRVIDLAPARGGRPPTFPGMGPDVADEVRRRMRTWYEADAVPVYLDRTAQRLLAEGRAAYRRLSLDQQPLLSWGRDTVLLPWRGDKIMNTLSVVLRDHRLEVGQDGVALTVRRTNVVGLWELIRQLACAPPPDPLELAEKVANKAADKHDNYLDDALLTKSYAARSLDVPGAWSALRMLAETPRPE
ncbi:DEAD/DEAH box helicase [Actinopolymorpha sp. B9G3]|uniref:DEAD/DEAH box helicase n=1 Tax=Actinopolymorpha sp. B9G3 TaxID=3158970 RepID=UPI0032D96F24